MLALPAAARRTAGRGIASPPRCSRSSYSCAVITPVFSGLAWDLTGMPWAAFIPLRCLRAGDDGARPNGEIRRKVIC